MDCTIAERREARDKSGAIVIETTPTSRRSPLAFGFIAMIAGLIVTMSASALSPRPPREPDEQPPTEPSNLNATPYSGTQINLGWTPSSDDVGVAGYVIERCTGSGCVDFLPIDSSIGPGYNDVTVASATSYNYRVSAFDAVGNSSGVSNTASATTPDSEAPTMPGNVHAVPVSGTQIDLSWSGSSDNVGVAGYFVEQCVGVNCSSFSLLSNTSMTSLNSPGLTNGTSYSYRLRARDGAGNFSAYSSIATAVTLDTQAPGVPGGLTATIASDTQIDLKWNASSDNVGVGSYRLERCTGSGCLNFSQIATTSTTSYSNTDVAAATSYRYRVLAVDAAGNLSVYSIIANATTPDTHAPTQPQTVTPTVVSTTQINLVWTPATDNVGVTQYRVERCSGAGCTTFVEIAAPTATSFSSMGLSASTTYRYRIRAGDAAGNLGVYSNAAIATTLVDSTAPTAPKDLRATPISSSKINLIWTASTDDAGVTGYRIERCSGRGCLSFAEVGTSSGINFNDTGLSASTNYNYRVRAFDSAGNLSSYSGQFAATTLVVDTQPPTVPSNFTATPVLSRQVDLTWAASSDNASVAGYRIERCVGAGCTNFIEIAAPTGLSFSDTTTIGATTYLYRVRAVDTSGNFGSYSNTAATTPSGSETVAYTYDAKGRLVKVFHQNGVNNGAQSNYTYDKANNRKSEATTGAH